MVHKIIAYNVQVMVCFLPQRDGSKSTVHKLATFSNNNNIECL